MNTGSNEYNWGVSGEYETRRISAAKVRRIDRIAKRIGGKGCGFTYYLATEYTPARTKFWFCAPNRGEPFDRNTRAAIDAAIVAAGITIP